MGTQVVHAEKLSTSRKGTNVQMDKQGSEVHVLLQQTKKKGATKRERGLKGVPSETGGKLNFFFNRKVQKNRNEIETKRNQMLSTRQKKKKKNKNKKQEQKQEEKRKIIFQPILCHPHTQIRIILFHDVQRDIPNLEFSPSRAAMLPYWTMI